MIRGHLTLILAPLLLLPACSNQENAAEDSGQTEDSESLLPEPTLGLSTQTLVHDDVTRSYLLYVPESYDSASPAPLMLNFHGFGGTSEGQMQSSDMRALADSEGFILAYPQGTLLDGDPHWNVSPPSADNKSDADDIGFIDALLAEITAGYALDSSRVYATGYSNGGDFTYTLACYSSDRITGIAPVSGLMWQQTLLDCSLAHPTALMSFNGTNDSARPYEGYEGYLLSVDATLAFWADENGLDDAPSVDNIQDSGLTIERSLYEGGTDGVAMTHYKVIGGGHVWFNFEDEGVPTNQVIWDFLSAFDSDGN
jgi:polyhydroxybutyrate depolymerase